MPNLLIVGAGYVADYYLSSLQLHPALTVAGVFDRDSARLQQSCAYWKVPSAESFEALLARGEPGDVVLNLTNPASHYDVSRACLEAGFHVWSEKPLATEMPQATELVELAAARGLRIAAAPCSFLGEAAQTLWAAVREEVAGPIRLVYAEMDDGFIPQAPWHKWIGESGAPWPGKDEFEVGCTLEHAGYWLTWLLPIFGPVRTVAAASAHQIPKEGVTDHAAPDISIGTLFFESGVIARLTCSIIAPHNHGLKVIGDRGVIEMDEAWNNGASVRYRPRFSVRRRLVNSPLTRQLRLPGPTHAMRGKNHRKAGMNFALGPVEMCESIAENRSCRMSPELSLHVTEVTLALQNAGEHGGSVAMETRFDPVAPMPWAAALKA